MIMSLPLMYKKCMYINGTDEDTEALAELKHYSTKDKNSDL